MVDSFAVRQTGAPGAIRVGDVLDKSFGLFLARCAPFVGLSLLAYAPSLILGLLVLASPPKSGVVILTILSVILPFVCASLANAAITYGVVQELRGRGFTFSESLRIGFGRMGAVIGLSLLLGLFIGLAMLLLVVPGIIVSCIYAVAVPVCIIESLGPRASMTRSAFLTKDNRWRIFGLFVLIGVAGLILSLIFGFVAELAGGIYLGQVASYVIQAIFGSFNAIVVGVLYYQLRVAREGADIDQIAAVFD